MPSIKLCAVLDQDTFQEQIYPIKIVYKYIWNQTNEVVLILKVTRDM